MSTYYRRRRLRKPSDLQKTKQGDYDEEEENKNSNNRLLAGYLASEFLTQGTIFGHSVEAQSMNRSESVQGKGKCYDEVMNLLKSEGAQLPGIVNPSQLDLWLHNVLSTKSGEIIASDKLHLLVSPLNRRGAPIQFFSSALKKHSFARVCRL